MKKWRITLLAKGIQQTFQVSHLGAYVETVSISHTGSQVLHTFRLLTVNQKARTARAVFDNSRSL